MKDLSLPGEDYNCIHSLTAGLVLHLVTPLSKQAEQNLIEACVMI